MAFTYDATNLVITTSGGRINVVRFLLGDTDSTDPQLQDEEITFALGQTTDNVYYAAGYCASSIAAKYSRLVDTDLDGALAERNSTLAKAYRALSAQLRQDAQRYSGNALGVFIGGNSYAAEDLVRSNTDRPLSAFLRDQFKIDNYGDY